MLAFIISVTAKKACPIPWSYYYERCSACEKLIETQTATLATSRPKMNYLVIRADVEGGVGTNVHLMKSAVSTTRLANSGCWRFERFQRANKLMCRAQIRVNSFWALYPVEAEEDGITFMRAYLQLRIVSGISWEVGIVQLAFVARAQASLRGKYSSLAELISK